jgi:hypothetical protein
VPSTTFLDPSSVGLLGTCLGDQGQLRVYECVPGEAFQMNPATGGRSGVWEYERHGMEGFLRAAPAQSFEPLVEMAMNAQEFSAYWSQCDSIATYLARMIGHNRTDSPLYSNLFSSAINELLEIAYRNQHNTGVVACRISRREDIDRIEISIPCDSGARQFLLEAIERLSSPGSEARYLLALTSEAGEGLDVGLLELKHEYNAAIFARAENDGRIALVVDLRLENPGVL